MPPSLDAEALERIEVANYRIHKDYATKLEPLLMNPLELIGSPSFVLGVTGYVEPMPKQPIGLAKILGSYAIALFNAEAIEYPAQAKIQDWFSELAKKVEEHIIYRVVKKRTVLTGNLTYHATEEEMREAIRTALSAHLSRDRFPRGHVALPPPPAALIEAATQAVELVGNSAQSNVEVRSAKRKAFVEPLLRDSGMTPNGWAKKAGFDPSVVYEYLNGKSNPRPNTRKTLAEALGIKPTALPG